jgi:hypothetical protein
MMILQKIVAVSILACAIGGPTLASDADDTGNPGMLLFSNGTMVRLKADSKMHPMIMRYAKPYAGNSIIYARDGRLYSIENVKMSDGRMLFDVLSPSNPDFMPDFNR